MNFSALAILFLASYACGVKVLTSCGANRKLIALTFDDGPNLEHGVTEKILEKLTNLGIKATFFSSPAAMGEDDKQMQGRCEMVKKLAKAGMQVGIHNWKHERSVGMTNSKLGQNIDHVVQWLGQCGIAKPTQYRPPYGILTDAQAGYISNDKGLTVAMWNVEPNDGESKRGGAQIFNAGFKDFEQNVGVGNSAIWSLHDGMFGDNAINDFFPLIVKKYKELGYEFVTMDQCYQKCDKQECLDAGGPKPDKNIFHPRKLK